MDLSQDDIDTILLWSGVSFLLTIAVLIGGYSLLFQG